MLTAYLTRQRLLLPMALTVILRIAFKGHCRPQSKGAACRSRRAEQQPPFRVLTPGAVFAEESRPGVTSSAQPPREAAGLQKLKYKKQHLEIVKTGKVTIKNHPFQGLLKMDNLICISNIDSKER